MYQFEIEKERLRFRLVNQVLACTKYSMKVNLILLILYIYLSLFWQSLLVLQILQNIFKRIRKEVYMMACKL